MRDSSTKIVFEYAEALTEVRAFSFAFREGVLMTLGRNGLINFAVILGRCELCVETFLYKDEYRDLKKRSAIILIPSLVYRCNRPECPAGGDETGYDGYGRPVGLPYDQWTKILGL